MCLLMANGYYLEYCYKRAKSIMSLIATASIKYFVADVHACLVTPTQQDHYHFIYSDLGGDWTIYGNG
ncbi:unnamed protein product [Absidia cylindrospora]